LLGEGGAQSANVLMVSQSTLLDGSKDIFETIHSTKIPRDETVHKRTAKATGQAMQKTSVLSLERTQIVVAATPFPLPTLSFQFLNPKAKP
jgi:hypothetical protein